MIDLEELQRKIVAFRDERDWKQYHNPKDMAISLSLEASELLEIFQWQSPEEIAEMLKHQNNELNDELVDVLYWVLLLAYDLNVDIPSSFEAKMAKNALKYPVEKAKGRHTKYDKLI